MPYWYAPFNDGWLPMKLFIWKVWLCGLKIFGGHQWTHKAMGDSGEYESTCMRCGADAERDVPED
jgi:hypothetical protein